MGLFAFVAVAREEKCLRTFRQELQGAAVSPRG